ncbi:MAG: hypothetical protein U1E30_03145 [Rhodoblastus sp.]
MAKAPSSIGQAVGQRRGVHRRDETSREHDEFVAAEARQQVGFAQTDRKTAICFRAGRRLDDHVIVDDLEVVESM